MIGDIKGLQNYALSRDRSRKSTKTINRYGYAYLIAFALTTSEDVLRIELINYKECMVSKDSDKWRLPMLDEMKSLK